MSPDNIAIEKEDFPFVVFVILENLYVSLKCGTSETVRFIEPKVFGITEKYWQYIIEYLVSQCWVTSLSEGTEITPKGITYLHTDPLMAQMRMLCHSVPSLCSVITS